MKKKCISAVMSVVMLIASGSYVYANGSGLPLPGEREALEIVQGAAGTKIEEAALELNEIQEKGAARYIVKLKDNTAEGLETVTETAYAAAKMVKEEKAAAVLDRKGIGLEDIYDEDGAEDSATVRLRETLGGFAKEAPAIYAQELVNAAEQPEIIVLQGGTQVIALPEKVDAEAFVQEVQEDLGEAIEYIQPDYEMELYEENSVTFEVSDGEITVPKAEEAAENGLKTQPVEEQEELVQKDPENAEGPIEPYNPAPTEETENQEGAGAGNENTNNEPERIDGDRLFEIEADLAGAWQVSRGEGTVVAVIDGGIDIAHPDLTEKMVSGWDFVKNTSLSGVSGVDGDSVHGTHVAGIIAQTAPEAKILPIRVFENGKAYTSDIIAAIAYAKNNGAQIVNCSFGSTGENLALREAIEESGLFFVCAAGNNRMNLEETPIYPAALGLDNVVSVAALNQDLGMSYFSNYGTEKTDVAAWGRDVYSTLPGGGYGEMNGTSMSAAYVSGAAALAAATEDGTAELKERICDAADKLSSLENKVKNCAKINFTALVRGEKVTETSSITAEDDFDVLGYQRTAAEDWELYSSTKNVQVAAGYEHVLVLKENGTVWSWGRNNEGELGDNTQETRSVPKQIIGLTNIVQIAAGEMYSMALKNDGTVWTWGKNQNGQLGDGTYTTRKLPVKVTGISAVKEIEAGYAHSMAVTEDGKLYSWGSNKTGQLGGSGTAAGGNQCTPQYADLDNVKSVSAGKDHSLAVKANGEVYAWGNAEYGKTGHTGTEIGKVSGLSNITQAAAGQWFSAALDEDGKVWTWGRNNVKELGREISGSETSVPGIVPDLEGVVSISAMDRHTLAVKDDGSLWTWGWNAAGQLGDGTLENRRIPKQVMENVMAAGKTVSAGAGFSVALETRGKAVAWGSNTAGQLGDGVEYMTTTPVLSSEMGTDVKYLSGGGENTVVLHENGQVSAWGENSCGELGRGIYGNADIPKEGKIEGLTGIVSVDAGGHHTLALDGNGNVWSWGKNAKGELGNGTTQNAAAPSTVAQFVKAIAAGSNHSLAVLNDGGILSWGDNAYGQLGETAGGKRTTPAILVNLEGVKAVAAGMNHSVALLNDGTVWTWGRNHRGQLGDGTQQDSAVPVEVGGLPEITAIAAKGNHTMALDATGNVWLWGDNWYRQVVNDNQSEMVKTPIKRTDISGIVDIAANDRESMVLKSDGSVWSWGQNDSGRLGDGSKINKAVATKMLNVSGVQAPADITLGHTIAAGFYHAAVNVGGQVYSTGANNKCQLGSGRVMNKNTPYELDNAVNHFYGVSFDDAYQIAPGTTKGTIVKASEAQYFKFLVPENGIYTIYSSADKPYQMSGTLFDVNQNQLEEAEGWNPSYAYMDIYENPGNFVMNKELQKGSFYYLKIEGSAAYAPYTLYIKKQDLTVSVINGENNITVNGNWIPASDVTIKVMSSDTETAAQAIVCDASGKFTHTFENIASGLYQLIVSPTDGETPAWQQSVLLGESLGIENAPVVPMMEETTMVSAAIAAGATQYFAIELSNPKNYAIYSVSENPADLSGVLLSNVQESVAANDDGMGDKIIENGSANSKDFVITKGMQSGRYYVAVTNKAAAGESVHYDLVLRALHLEAEVRGTENKIEIYGKRIPGEALSLTLSDAYDSKTYTPVYGDYRSFSCVITDFQFSSACEGYVTLNSNGEIPAHLTVDFMFTDDGIAGVSSVKPFEEFDHTNKEQLKPYGEQIYSYTAQELGHHALKTSGLGCTIRVYYSFEDLLNGASLIYSNTGILNSVMQSGHRYYIRITNNTDTAGQFDLTVEKINFETHAELTPTGIIVTGTTLYGESAEIVLTSYGGESYYATLHATGDENGQFYLIHNFTPKMSMYFLTCHYSMYEVVVESAYWGTEFGDAYTLSESTGNELLGQVYDSAYYTFTPAESGKYYIYSESAASIDLSGKLYSGASEDMFLAENDNSSEPANNAKDFMIEYDLTGGNVYYLKVTRSESGMSVTDYKIHISRNKPGMQGAVQTVSCKAGESVYVFVTGKNITSFAGKKYVLTYDAAKLQVEDPHVFGETGLALEQQAGVLKFTVSKPVEPGRAYFGSLNVVKFKALSDGETAVSLKTEESI